MDNTNINTTNTVNYHEVRLIDKYLQDMSLVCGESVVMRGIRIYLYSHDKTITNLSSLISD